MNKETEVRFSYFTLGHPLRPDIPLLWSNRRFCEWAKSAGYASCELVPFRGAVSDVFKYPVEVLTNLRELKSGHSVLNPYATVWKVLTRRQDPLRKERKFGLYNLALVNDKVSWLAFRKLQEANHGEFPVVVYPYQNGRDSYINKYLQTHPAVFNDGRSAEQLIEACKSGKYSGIVWDCYHALEATSRGIRPLLPWQESLMRFIDAGVLKEVHLQAGRGLENDPFINDFEWLRELRGWRPPGETELGQMVRIVKEYTSRQNVPFVIEVPMQALIEGGFVRARAILEPNLDQIKSAHAQIIDHVQRI